MALPPTLLQLREATAADHGRMEAIPRMRAARGDGLTLSAYVELLALMYGFYAPLERALSACPIWGRHGFDFAARRKLPLLARDLACFGWAGDALAALPTATAPALDDDATALGCMYVLEGATLGSQLLARHVGERLHLRAESGAAFFCCYGEEVGPMWRGFCELLLAHCGPERVDERLVVAARATFADMAAWLAGPAPAAPGALHGPLATAHTDLAAHPVR